MTSKPHGRLRGAKQPQRRTTGREFEGFGRGRWLLPAALAALGAGPVAAQNGHPDFTGIWSGNFTTQDDEFWQVEDFTICFAGCTPTSREYFGKLLDDPANDARPVRELWNQTTAFMRQELAEKSTPRGLELQAANNSANDPTLLCQPYGLVRAAVNPLPMRIRTDGGNIVIDYEEWNESRTIYMDGRGHPADLTPSRLGHSIGRYEGDTLVVDSTGIQGDIYYSFQSGGAYSDQVHVVERYTLHDDPRRLIAELTVTDPSTLRAPQVIEKIWLYTPDLVMIEDRCGDIPGKP
jgi:hypothetical protein